MYTKTLIGNPCLQDLFTGTVKNYISHPPLKFTIAKRYDMAKIQKLGLELMSRVIKLVV